MNVRVQREFLWDGRRCVELGAEALRGGQAVSLQLPVDYNHALFQRLHPHASPGATETIDARGGAELIDEAAKLPGLSALAELADTARAIGARVAVRSPAIISIEPGATSD